ncbi:stage V sporulation protein S [Defluviitoga tunisiensis]|jgi:stage V sporulation protein S|uniref:Stage V sporulation protein S n=1 Tax=Defluviitoga tunisiensis TaxID=1006576 RepID=A0A0C7NY69_DEFTU|nr:stage V sporulation protein S [Defluviitoga tunisiensis]MDD3601544.1 stage V sporulation protein S [Defluviitoga tunisiensis]MDY0379655.1 stage V sporulation protein S [Defluviitoga tunisiensis]CEP78213.1 Stage V sporulation protein S [Defluviitoga tunisiensis]HOK16936.1 stage V sporulation protein S [Defluviitoga tunisiensis]HOP34664.1 stage V sporulation protein S [Defluviitoga tunisiensis]
MEVLKVSHSSAPNKVAGAIAGVLSKTDEVELQAIGAGAVNQAVKAIAIAKRFVEAKGKEIYVIPGFVEVEVGSEKRTGIKFKVVAKSTGEAVEEKEAEVNKVNEEQ